ncbi:MAG: RNA dependent RNA polymerase [Lachnospiraceae bacterium]
MTNHPLYIRKYHSARLKEFGWEVNDTFAESKKQNEIIGLADSQILRTIRDVTQRTINKETLEQRIRLRNFYEHRQAKVPRQSPYAAMIAARLRRCMNKQGAVWDRLRRQYLLIGSNGDEAKRLQDKINRTLFQEDYVTVVMDTASHYRHLFQYGFTINGNTYRRLSCSAGQARVSTVVFCREEIIPEVSRRLNNGRNLSKKFSPSKFNAYFGLAGSATAIVSEPNFIVVRDYENTTSFMANYVIENSWKTDDTVIQKEMKDVPMNRTDGMGLISPRQARQWADELGLDYLPSQFCIRQNFIKGMLCVFPIHEFANEYGKLDARGRCMVDTIYSDDSGNPIQANLFDYDVILSESQFKLWDSFDSLDQYIQNCRKNRLYWGVSLTTPKEAKHMLKLNYQFIQTLNLNQEDIVHLAEPFISWLSGVSYQDRYYMLLFLLGVNNDEEKIRRFLSGSDAYWIKALLANDSVKHDKYIRTKIRELLKHKIRNACKGDIYADGNFQVIVSDPFGFMQHVCGLPVTGLLKPGKAYSNYWNERNITQVDAMRSPLTYFSEHVILDLQKDQETEKWYRYCRLGIILGYHGHETFRFAGSDFDYDILATTSNQTMINGVIRDELPVVYEAPRPQKILFDEEDLYLADTFSFGSIIGSITNKSSNGYALLPLLEQTCGSDSAQYRLVRSRLQQCCKAQSAQIDKAKIGQEVKGIPKTWITRNKLKTDKHGNIRDRHEKRTRLYNETLLDTYPYFFRYVYKDTDKKYKKHLDEYHMICRQKFRMNFTELEALTDKTEEQQALIQQFYRYCPVTISSSSMNLLCRYIEGIDFQISKNTKIQTNSNVWELYKCPLSNYSDYYEIVRQTLKQYLKECRQSVILHSFEDSGDSGFEEEKIGSFETVSDNLCDRMAAIHPNPNVILNCLVDYYYLEQPSANKDLLWKSYGKYIYRNLRNNAPTDQKIRFPLPADADDYDLTYLGYHYKLQEVSL